MGALKWGLRVLVLKCPQVLQVPSFCDENSFLQKCPKACDSPDPRQGPEIPISWKRGVAGAKSPFPLALTGWKREFSVKKTPFPLCSLAAKIEDAPEQFKSRYV